MAMRCIKLMKLFLEKYILILVFLAFLEVKVVGKMAIQMLA